MRHLRTSVLLCLIYSAVAARADELRGVVVLQSNNCPVSNLVVEVDPRVGSPQSKVVTTTSLTGDFVARVMSGVYLLVIYQQGNKVYQSEVQVSGTTNVTVSVSASGSSGGPHCVSVVVPAQTMWKDTQIQVRQGDAISFAATGEIEWTPGQVVGPDGSSSKKRPVRGRPAYPVAEIGAGGLIARVGSGKAFVVGKARTVVAKESGALYLGINDNNWKDNTGDFSVSVSVTTPQ